MLNTTKIIFFLGLMMTGFFSLNAHGYGYYSYAGEPIVWKNGGTDKMYIDRDCYPSGSEDGNIIVNAMHEWENVGGSDFKFNAAFAENEDGKIKYYDGKSEIICTTKANVDEDTSLFYDWDGQSGVTIKAYGWNIASTWITEADIYFVEDAGGTSGNTPTHELGHALGLCHTTDYGLMGYNYGDGHPGDHPYAPVADDRQGIRYLYPQTSEKEVDLMVSSYEAENIISSDGEKIFGFTYLKTFYDYSIAYDEVCPGDTITLRRTLINNGTEEINDDNAEVRLSYVFANEEEGKDIVAKTTELLSLASGSASTDEVMLTVPDELTVELEYDVYSIIDSENTLKEEDETNNRARIASNLRRDEECPVTNDANDEDSGTGDEDDTDTNSDPLVPMNPYPVELGKIVDKKNNDDGGSAIDLTIQSAANFELPNFIFNNNEANDELKTDTDVETTTDSFDENTDLEVSSVNDDIGVDTNDVEVTSLSDVDFSNESSTGGGCSMNGNVHSQGVNTILESLFVLGMLLGIRLMNFVKKEKPCLKN